MPDLPEPSVVWQAVETYLSRAYQGAAIPKAVRDRLDALKTSGDSLYSSPAWELDNKSAPAKYMLRLGNKHYPHMKLSIDRRPDGPGFLFRADTHDRHINVPAGSKEHAIFA